ncbi:Probable N-acetyltransferase san (N-epsilon-acetyltransferase san) (Protein atado) (Protein separation anxiety) [Durusdinium trenchii]|uniref:Probable N-acetyltransferase san (N-epsilon-acetyltransferase san) (Protein atado) (Protein separation anxiety) n=1 Tax=Durusdinium trenchii TaxID=1381693 RepID=A0ABP0JVK4_9DINO
MAEGETSQKALKLDLGNLTEKNMGQLKKLNTATFPVKYKDQFYLDLVKYFDFCRLGFYADVLVGSICCRLEDRDQVLGGGKALYIMTLSILKPYRQRSLASQLVQWILDRAQSKECQDKDVREIYLHVQTSNKTALQFYKKFGFKVTQEIKDYYHNIDPPDCYVLRPLVGALPVVQTPLGTAEGIFAAEGVVVTVSYRLGALGFLVSESFDGPGNGGMNGIRDIATALRWIQRFIPYFKGDPNRVTVFGQSSGAYATCTLTVAPEAKGLFRRAILQSGPCFGGPPNRGWGPRNVSYGLHVAKEVMAAANVSSLAELREVPAEKVQWPAYTMNDPAVAPYFSGYFEDPGFLPASADKLWAEGKVNPEAIMVGFNSKDGTAAFYGVAPTMGYVPPDENQTGANDYEKAIRKVWGTNADAVLQQYPLSRFDGSPQKAFLQADADSMVICPSYQLLRYAQAMDVPSWAFEFAHFIPSARPDGFGCSNGPELDVAPPRRGAYTSLRSQGNAQITVSDVKLFAIHGDDDPWQENSGKKKGLELCAAEVKFVFGNEEMRSLAFFFGFA